MRDDSLRIADMREALERIQGFASGGRAAFFSDPKTNEAIAYEMLKLGEAAGRVSAPFRKKHTEVPWRRLASLRNEIVHEYFRIDLDSLWEFVQSELDAVDRALRGL